MFTLIGPAAAGDFAPISLTMEARGAVRVRVTGPDGTYDAYQMPDGSFRRACLRVPNAAKQAAMDAATTSATTDKTKRAHNLDRLRTLGRRAARYAKDPTANASDDLLPGVTNGAAKRAAHELLARSALTLVDEFSDDT